MEKRKLSNWIGLIILVISMSGYFAGRADAKNDKENSKLIQIENQEINK